jgi:hypothetical protein
MHCREAKGKGIRDEGRDGALATTQMWFFSHGNKMAM